MQQEIIGYHGTDKANVQSIIQNGFNCSNGDSEWLGKGIYFFVKGVGCPITHAIEWAKCQAYDKTNKCNKYYDYAILSAKVSTNSVFDLTQTEHKNYYHVYVDNILKKYKNLFKNGRDLSKDSAHIWEFFDKNCDFDVIKKDVEIKNRERRIKKLTTHVDNATIICVKKTALISDIKMQQEGKVE